MRNRRCFPPAHVPPVPFSRAQVQTLVDIDHRVGLGLPRFPFSCRDPRKVGRVVEDELGVEPRAPPAAPRDTLAGLVVAAAREILPWARRAVGQAAGREIRERRIRQPPQTAEPPVGVRSRHGRSSSIGRNVSYPSVRFRRPALVAAPGTVRCALGHSGIGAPSSQTDHPRGALRGSFMSSRPPKRPGEDRHPPRLAVSSFNRPGPSPGPQVA